jgi:hypothetical protein
MTIRTLFDIMFVYSLCIVITGFQNRRLRPLQITDLRQKWMALVSNMG